MKVALLAASTLILATWGLQESNDQADDGLLVATAKGVGKLDRITSHPVKMNPQVSTLCTAPAQARPQAPHGDYYCHVFITSGGANTIRSGEGNYPVGTVIVKQKFADAKGKSTELYTLMRKMEPGYDPEHSDWEYSVVNRKATQVLARGKIASCIECHQSYRETDFVTRVYLDDEASAAE